MWFGVLSQANKSEVNSSQLIFLEHLILEHLNWEIFQHQLSKILWFASKRKSQAWLRNSSDVLIMKLLPIWEWIHTGNGKLSKHRVNLEAYTAPKILKTMLVLFALLSPSLLKSRASICLVTECSSPGQNMVGTAQREMGQAFLREIDSYGAECPNSPWFTIMSHFNLWPLYTYKTSCISAWDIQIRLY